MPPVKREPGGLKPGPVVTKPERTAPESNGSAPGVALSDTDESAVTAKPSHPWSSPASVIDKQGLSMFLFSNPGIGKTTLGLSMLHSLDGGPMLIINWDEELRSISDLGDDSGVSVWPGEKQGGKISSWQQAESFCDDLLRRKHPFKCFMFDTLNSAYDKFALPYVRAQNPGSKDPRQLFGQANDLLLRMITNYCGAAREKGWNVLFTGHAEEKQVGENGPIITRPKITPGVVLGLNQRVSIIGYLHPAVGLTPRKLQLEPSPKATAKIHQPRTGPKVPGRIPNPDLGLLINHLKHHVPYPSATKGSDSDG
ncbi:MAG TPA: AAA family ATPase [Nitrospira sp.]|nr:AAA family ATPase [Nitrospira sp.]